MERRPLSVAFGQVVRRERERRGLSQEALAAEAGVHRTHVSLVELGRHSVSLDVAGRFAAAFGMSLSALVGKVERKAHGGSDS